MTAASPAVLNTRKMSLRALARAREAGELEIVEQRPRYRGECVHGPRPCPWAGCRYHMAIAEYHADNGSLRIMAEDPLEMRATESCALDIAERGGITLEAVGELLGVTRERVRQIEARALRKIVRRVRFGRTEYGK